MEDKDIAIVATIVLLAIALVASFLGINVEAILASIATIVTAIGAYLRKIKSTAENKFKIVGELMADILDLEEKEIDLLGYIKTALKEPETIDQVASLMEKTIEDKIAKLREIKENLVQLLQ